MLTDEFEGLTIKQHVLKVHINCYGCMQKVKKILKKIEGVYTVSIDAEEQKVAVLGDVDASVLLNKLIKTGKHAEIWESEFNELEETKNDTNQQEYQLGQEDEGYNSNQFMGLKNLMNEIEQNRGTREANMENKWNMVANEDHNMMEFPTFHGKPTNFYHGYNHQYPSSVMMNDIRDMNNINMIGNDSIYMPNFQSTMNMNQTSFPWNPHMSHYYHNFGFSPYPSNYSE